LLAAVQQEFAKTGYALKLCTVWKGTCGINRKSVPGGMPLANGIKILEREAERVHPHMANCARRIGAMRFETRPHR